MYIRIEGSLEKEQYTPGVQPYNPMAKTAAGRVDIFMDISHTLNSNSPETCMNYTPISTTPNRYQPGYKAKIFREEPLHSGKKRFENKEARVMSYQPGKEFSNRTGWHYTVSDKIFRRESLFSRILTKVLKTINRWGNRLRR